MVKYTEVCFDERESSKNEVAQLMKLLQKETDELCPLSTNEICNRIKNGFNIK